MMDSERRCPRCQGLISGEALFCGLCGLAVGDARESAGRTPHPDPLTPPAGFRLVGSAADLFFAWHPAWGGGHVLLGTEPLIVQLFNAGHGLVNVTVEVVTRDRDGRELSVLPQEIEELPRAETREIEIASYDMPAPISDLSMRFVHGEFASPPAV